MDQIVERTTDQTCDTPVSEESEKFPIILPETTIIPELGNSIKGDKDEFDNYSEFETLSEHDVTVNLKLLGDIKEGEKIRIDDGKFMQIDQRYGQFLRRWWTDDSRKRAIKFVRYVILSAQGHCNIAVSNVNDQKSTKEQKEYYLQKLIKFQGDLNCACVGLGRMTITYDDDKQNRAKIETIQREVSTFCNEHLKKVTMR